MLRRPVIPRSTVLTWDIATPKVLFDETPIIEKLRVFLSICEAVGRSACVKNPAAGVTVVDPLDGMSFTWNPTRRRKQQIRSGAFKLLRQGTCRA